jgi:hypothetical protein
MKSASKRRIGLVGHEGEGSECDDDQTGDRDANSVSAVMDSNHRLPHRGCPCPGAIYAFCPTSSCTQFVEHLVVKIDILRVNGDMIDAALRIPDQPAFSTAPSAWPSRQAHCPTWFGLLPNPSGRDSF